jgi:hypothetical protein
MANSKSLLKTSLPRPPAVGRDFVGAASPVLILRGPRRFQAFFARTAHKMCNLALSDAGIKRFSSVIQRFRLTISPYDQRRWRRDGWAVRPGQYLRPKLVKEMHRVAWQGKYLQSAEIRTSPVNCGCIGRADALAPVRSAMDSISKSKLSGSGPFLIPDIIKAPTLNRSPESWPARAG